ncbi:glycosyltransferase [Terriglobus saanensis]|uniref:Glycosyl transferase group 1 n=1 Tax=Terriglobus saanensis (strain ATCC BAA-1853 / DSM 23119 / SP1PR4) TaxID=401053 RepID=E8UYQ9_TERSS|nr:glycosyltransferase [Terriglobus saanensis]ADV84275.1 glycosyl transferase group 1 [Terriglobus saanensis SP1PR4]
MRVAILHHWFVTRGGGERVAECIASLFPGADLITLVSADSGLPESLKDRKLTTSYLQNIPGAVSHHRQFLPLYPSAVEHLDVREYDLIVSSDSGPIKGVLKREDATHLCYCHSPMRYLWDAYDQYRNQMYGPARLAFTLTAKYVRDWDALAARRVTAFAANSNYVADRISRYYGRESTVIHPPIDLQRVRILEPQDHYLAAGRLVFYKRTDLLIAACNRLNRPLRIAGTGPEEARLRKLAGPNVTFLGELSDEDLWNEYARARALLFAADEDFGMVPLEAQACGRPVIAYGAGGSLETVDAYGDQPTGVYFPSQSEDALIAAIEHFESIESSFCSTAIQKHAENFATPIFLQQMRDFVLSHAPQAMEAMAPLEECVALERSTLLRTVS